MERTIKDVISGLVLQIKEHGYREPALDMYSNVYQSLINHCNRKGGELYNNQIPNEFLSKAAECFENGLHCNSYYRFIKRAVRLLDTFARTGKADFSRSNIPKKYVPSLEHQDLINKILNENRLVKDAFFRRDRIMRHFFCFLEEASIEISSVDDNTLFLFIQTASATKKGSMNRVIRAVKLISEYLKKHKMTKLRVDFSMIKLKSAPVRMIAPYSRDEMNRMIDSIDLKTSIGVRDHAILLLALETGLRGIDVIKLRLSDINWKNAEVHIIQSKTNEPLSLPLSGAVMNAIADYILKVRPESFFHEIFLSSKSPYRPFSTTPSLNEIVEKYCLLAGIEKKPLRAFHSLRRSFATELSIAGVPLPTISQILGHKSIKEVSPYLSYDRKQILFCAMGFDEIPIIDGIYVSTSSPDTFGGDDK